jgi:aldehyde:ferredoxin oxidoreductase
VGEFHDNQIAYINLSAGEVKLEEITRELRKNYIGGPGINTKILYDSNAAENDALSEMNLLIFGIGPSVGTGLPASNRCTITAKSPITDAYGDSNLGGEFNIRLRTVGIDHLVFSGKSDHPVYVLIKSQGEIEILDATDLWGMHTEKVTELLIERHGKGSEVCCIGPAGENLVRFASVIMSKCHVAGRTGMGCVMGSKKLKAIVVEKKIGKPKVYNPEKIKEIRDEWIKKCRASVILKSGNIQGTLMLIKRYHKQGALPIRNYQMSDDKMVKNLYPEKFLYKHETKRKACIYCPVGCAREYEIKEGKHKGEKGDRIDYGAVAGIGPYNGIFDWASILHLKNLSDNLGFDAIEGGSTIGFILECYQRGLIKDPEKTYEFGNADDVEELMYKICRREGIGDIAAEGAYRASLVLHAEKYAFCIRKSSAGLHSNSHLAKSLSYLTSTRGGDHLKGYVFTAAFGGFFSEVVSKHIFKSKAEKNFAKAEQKGRVVCWHENYKYVVDCLGLCLFAVTALPSAGAAYFNEFAEITNAVLDMDLTDEEMFSAGDRIYQLQNAFNVACGLKFDDYHWPERKKEEDVKDKFIKGTTIKVGGEEGMLPEYFRYRGLTSKGTPTIGRFKELGISQYIKKADAEDIDNVLSMEDLLKEIDLNAELTPKENRINNFMSSLICKLMTKQDKKALSHMKNE